MILVFPGPPLPWGLLRGAPESPLQLSLASGRLGSPFPAPPLPVRTFVFHVPCVTHSVSIQPDVTLFLLEHSGRLCPQCDRGSGGGVPARAPLPSCLLSRLFFSSLLLASFSLWASGCGQLCLSPLWARLAQRLSCSSFSGTEGKGCPLACGVSRGRGDTGPAQPPVRSDARAVLWPLFLFGLRSASSGSLPSPLCSLCVCLRPAQALHAWGSRSLWWPCVHLGLLLLGGSLSVWPPRDSESWRRVSEGPPWGPGLSEQDTERRLLPPLTVLEASTGRDFHAYTPASLADSWVWINASESPQEG